MPRLLTQELRRFSAAVKRPSQENPDFLAAPSSICPCFSRLSAICTFFRFGVRFWPISLDGFLGSARFWLIRPVCPGFVRELSAFCPNRLAPILSICFCLFLSLVVRKSHSFRRHGTAAARSRFVHAGRHAITRPSTFPVIRPSRSSLSRVSFSALAFSPPTTVHSSANVQGS